MKLNYIILAHKNPLQVKRLIERLRSSNCNFYLHVDKNVEEKPFRELLSSLPEVTFLTERQKGTWGGIGIVLATIIALKQIVAEKREGYCILLSAQDYPVKSNAYIENFFKSAQNVCFMDIWPIPWDGWYSGGLDRIKFYRFHLSEKPGDYIVIPPLFTKDFLKNRHRNLQKIKTLIRAGKNILPIFRKRNLPKDIKPYGGSQWWALPIEVAELIVEFLNHNPGYIEFHRYTLLADEVFFQTIVSNMPANVVKIEPSVTYYKWDGPESAHPVTFTSKSLEELLALPPNKLFARKMDLQVDQHLFNLIDEVHCQSPRQPA